MRANADIRGARSQMCHAYLGGDRYFLCACARAAVCLLSIFQLPVEANYSPPAVRTDMAGDSKFFVVIAVAVYTIFLSSLEVNAHNQ